MADEHDNAEELASAQRELEEATRLAAEIGQRQQSLELVQMSGKLDAAGLREEMATVQAEMQRTQAQVQRAAERVRREMDVQMRRMQRDLDAKMQAFQQALAPVKKRLDLIQEGIETLGLYLSAAEGVVTLRDGQRADAEETIILRQTVLSMDEETGLFAEEGGMNSGDIEEFDKWLLSDPSHVQQIIPESKSVVALIPRRVPRDRHNPFTHDEKDKITHFLIRNGDALFRTTVKDFMAGQVLLPRADEFIDFFFERRYNYETRQQERVALEPGTQRYAEAMERSDKRRRHFMRIGLILQGLVDNSEVFHPLHPAGIDMLRDPSYRSEKVRIITDAEGALDSGQETFLEWQKRINAQLRPGMRIIGAFNGEPWRDANEFSRESRYKYNHSRVRPLILRDSQPSPPSGVPIQIEERGPHGALIARFPRGEVYDRDLWIPNPDRPGWGWRGGRRPSKQRASVTVYPHDDFILAYDLIDSSAQLRGFLASRQNRQEYQVLWPLIRAAMFAKAQEEKAEAPFLTMLAGVLARENGVTVAEAEADIPDLVRWFKLTNKWTRPLTLETMTGLEAAEEMDDQAADENERTAKGRLTMAAIEARTARMSKLGWETYDEDAYKQALELEASGKLKGQEHAALAVRLIVSEHARRLADRRKPINEKLVATLRAEHPQALLIARPRSGGYLVVLPAHPTRNVWVHELDYSARGKLRERRDWKTLGGMNRVSRWTVCYESDRFKDWLVGAAERDHLRDGEIAELGQRMLTEAVKEGETPMAVSYRDATPTERGRFTVWARKPEDDRDRRNRDEGPQAVARDRYWRREGERLTLVSPGYWDSSEHNWSADGEKLPWEGTYAKRHYGETVWGPDTHACAIWVKDRHDWTVGQEQQAEIRKRAYDLGYTIIEQWRAEKAWALYEQFVADVPDARFYEWEDHYKKHKPEWAWHDSHHHAQGDLGAMLQWLVGQGVDPSGLTAQQALESARERGLPEQWEGWNTNTYPERFPGEWAGFVIGAEARPLPTETEHVAAGHQPSKPAPPRAADPNIVELGDGVEVLLSDEPEPQRDMFDDLRDALGGLDGQGGKPQ